MFQYGPTTLVWVGVLNFVIGKALWVAARRAAAAIWGGGELEEPEGPLDFMVEGLRGLVAGQCNHSLALATLGCGNGGLYHIPLDPPGPEEH